MISILCPCYNEEEVLPIFFREIIPVIEDINETFEFVCVNDGSTDLTVDVLLQLSQNDDRIKIVDFSRNFGKEAALTAAIDYASGDAAIPIDVDLQNPPELIPQMITKWREGYEVVLAKRTDRASDSFLRRFFSHFFYHFHNKISHPQIPENVGDFRLMDRRVLDVLKTLREHHRFMKGLFAWTGFKTCTVDYACCTRIIGESKFNIWLLWKLAIEGITSFSTLPLTIWLYIGSLFSFCSFLYGLIIFFRTLFLGVELPGYASQICLISFWGGLQLLGIGILGEYIGRIYIESKHRPPYVVRRLYNISL